MADVYTTHAQAEVDRPHSRNVNPSYRGLQKTINHARQSYTFAATPSADDNIILGTLGVPNAVILPEHCRISSLNGAIQGVVRLEKVTEVGGTPTAVSGSATVNDNSVALTRISGNDTVETEMAELLQLTIPTVTAIVSGDILQIDIAYVSDDKQ